MRKIYTLLLSLFCCTICFAQIVNSYYQDGQEAYPGGEVKLYKDLREVMLQKQLQKCQTNEYLYIKLRIDVNGKPAFIKDEGNKGYIEKNPCAFNAAIKALSGISGWVPAKKGIITYNSTYEFPFFPNELLGDYNEGYMTSAHTLKAEYEGGEDAFRKRLVFLMDEYLGDMYRPIGVFRLSFVVNEKGEMSEFDIDPKVENTGIFLKDLNSVTKKMRKGWTPAKYKGIPIRSRYTLKINFLKD
ncbi:hypothetical protein [Elizabethkingia ursingii]|uniref:hypothetical protein n=1 Tax=Elizabethkingia ursingii TaxID=1756150 RepID=UPI0010566235|nr:hypothetical protein [Elizabethkingia ursingii]